MIRMQRVSLHLCLGATRRKEAYFQPSNNVARVRFTTLSQLVLTVIVDIICINHPIACFSSEHARSVPLAHDHFCRSPYTSQVAKLVVFLASEDASMVTGSSFVIDGGFTIKA